MLKLFNKLGLLKFIQEKNYINYLWSISVILYIFRSILAPLRDVFLISLMPLFIHTLYNLSSYLTKSSFRKIYVLKEYIMLGLFLVGGIFLSTGNTSQAYKDLINFFVVFFFTFIYLNNRENIDVLLFLKVWIYLSLGIAIFGISKWLFEVGGLDFIPSNYLYVSTPAMGSDMNFYGNHFIITIILFYSLLKRNILNFKTINTQLMLWVFLLNIILTGSRRSIIILTFLILLLILYLFLNKESSIAKRNITIAIYFLLTVFFLISFLIPFRGILIRDNKVRSIITSQVYHYSTIFTPNTDKLALYNKLWYPPRQTNDDSNLIKNGNFTDGLTFWVYSTPDTILHQIINTEYGNAVRVTREKGKGFWPLSYRGRTIYYHKNSTYQFSFKYRVIKGKGIPFKIGWWIKDDGRYIHDLSKKIIPLNNGWYECTCFYKFKEDHSNFAGTFMNSQEPNTILDFTDIKLISLDTVQKFNYNDQLLLNGYFDSTNRFIDPRTKRWKYAFSIYKEYNLLQKIIGDGFNYGQKYCEVFVKKESGKTFDYPHNPILSSFLYSGIIGGLFYIYFLVMSFYYYIKNRKTLQVFLYMYLVTFFFMMFSANSHFSVPIFTFLSVLPFIENYRQKERKNAH